MTEAEKKEWIPGGDVPRRAVLKVLETVRDALRDDPRADTCLRAAILAVKTMPGTRWVPVSERLPTREEYLENNGRFLIDDGNRRYEGHFDPFDREFKVIDFRPEGPVIHRDNCAAFWRTFPEPEKKENR